MNAKAAPPQRGRQFDNEIGGARILDEDEDIRFLRRHALLEVS
jgi:hypothetical protein